MARSRTNRKSGKKTGSRNQKGGRVVMPIQYFNPNAQVPQYYPRDSEILTKQYESAYGPIDAVSTTQPNSCLTSMGPNLAPFSPYNQSSGVQTGGAAYQQITNPLTGRKVNINSKLGRQILNEYIKRLN